MRSTRGLELDAGDWSKLSSLSGVDHRFQNPGVRFPEAADKETWKLSKY
jgi:hypothetical protein